MAVIGHAMTLAKTPALVHAVVATADVHLTAKTLALVDAPEVVMVVVKGPAKDPALTPTIYNNYRGRVNNTPS